MRPDLALTFPAPVGVQKNPRFLRKFQICGLITLLLDIGSLARGAKIHSHPQILTKKWPKNDEKRAILGVSLGGSKRVIRPQIWNLRRKRGFFCTPTGAGNVSAKSGRNNPVIITNFNIIWQFI